MNRGDLPMSTLVVIIGVLVGLIVLLPVLKNLFEGADPVVIEDTCRKSVMLRGFDSGFASATHGLGPDSPLLCETQQFSLPFYELSTSNAGLRKSAVKKDIADLMMRCWKQFGNGMVDNPFHQSPLSSQQCFVCSTFSINPSTIKNNEQISVGEFRDFLVNEAYAVDVHDPCYNGGGRCVTDISQCDSEEQAKPLKRPCGDSTESVCCVKKTECENKGGVCHGAERGARPDCKDLGGDVPYVMYSDYSCRGGGGIGEERSCCVRSDRAISYAYALQSLDGEGAIGFPPGEFSFRNDEQYGVMFVGAKESCGTDCKVWSSLAGTGGAAVALFLGPVGAIAVGAGVAYATVAGTSVHQKAHSIIVGSQDQLLEACPGGIVGGAFDD